MYALLQAIETAYDNGNIGTPPINDQFAGGLHTGEPGRDDVWQGEFPHIRVNVVGNPRTATYRNTGIVRPRLMVAVYAEGYDDGARLLDTLNAALDAYFLTLIASGSIGLSNVHRASAPRPRKIKQSDDMSHVWMWFVDYECTLSGAM